MMHRKTLCGLWAGIGATLTAGIAAAQTEGMRDGLEILGAPTPGATGFQLGVTEVARDIRALDTFLLIIMAGIVLFRQRAAALGDRAPQRARQSQAGKFTPPITRIEVTWTVVPLVILVVFGAFFRCRFCSSSRPFPWRNWW